MVFYLQYFQRASLSMDATAADAGAKGDALKKILWTCVQHFALILLLLLLVLPLLPF